MKSKTEPTVKNMNNCHIPKQILRNYMKVIELRVNYGKEIIFFPFQCCHLLPFPLEWFQPIH